MSDLVRWNHARSSQVKFTLKNDRLIRCYSLERTVRYQHRINSSQVKYQCQIMSMRVSSACASLFTERLERKDSGNGMEGVYGLGFRVRDGMEGFGCHHPGWEFARVLCECRFSNLLHVTAVEYVRDSRAACVPGCGPYRSSGAIVCAFIHRGEISL